MPQKACGDLGSRAQPPLIPSQLRGATHRHPSEMQDVHQVSRAHSAFPVQQLNPLVLEYRLFLPWPSPHYPFLLTQNAHLLSLMNSS